MIEWITVKDKGLPDVPQDDTISYFTYCAEVSNHDVMINEFCNGEFRFDNRWVTHYAEIPLPNPPA